MNAISSQFLLQDWIYEKRESISFITSLSIILFVVVMNLTTLLSKQPIQVATEMMAILESVPPPVVEKKIEEKKIEKRVEKSLSQPTERVVTTPTPSTEPSPEKALNHSVPAQKLEQSSAPSKQTIEHLSNPAIGAQYEAMLRAYLEKIKRYPSSREARLSRPEGVVKVWLELARSGELLGVGIYESSGFNLLDSETIKTIKSGTFPPFPETAFSGESSHKFVASMKYSISSN